MTTQGERDDEHPDLLRLDALRAGEGTPEELAHVASCPECTEELEALRLLAADVARMQPEAVRVPEEVDRAVLAAFRSAVESKVVPFPARRWLRWAGPAVALALAAGFGFLMVFPPPPLVRERETPTPLAALPAQMAPSVAPHRALPGEPPQEYIAARTPLRKTEATAPTGKATAEAAGERHVTILDAYRLALRVEQRGPEDAGWDANGDGIVDQKDVEAVARLAVALQ